MKLLLRRHGDLRLSMSFSGQRGMGIVGFNNDWVIAGSGRAPTPRFHVGKEIRSLMTAAIQYRPHKMSLRAIYWGIPGSYLEFQIFNYPLCDYTRFQERSVEDELVKRDGSYHLVDRIEME
jgi:hypothetical protein